ncbi:MAG: class IV adenylate cyclase [Candidatus Jordarchaeum sp.]|uniref:class IV adenylate cyclase n=1 Tax=Candidatus Jordarchaeum sp. TaxID=2823881 RepID=UPI004049C7A7
MIEVEIKCPISDPDRIAEKLVKKVCAKFIKTIFQKDVYLQHPSKNFKETDEAMRIRESVEGVQLTYKGPKIDSLSKTREELGVQVDNFESVLKIFLRIGFFPIANVNKSRKIFHIKENIIASIDQVQDLGNFLELESEAKDYSQIETKREELLSILDKLGLSRENTERRSYLELIIAKF